ncbi:hypothetical protein J6590_014123 [Homalodisca vitripennis]|nr:hypothetical protein J6590_014123 [Homalodisca vitripennis]
MTSLTFGYGEHPFCVCCGEGHYPAVQPEGVQPGVTVQPAGYGCRYLHRPVLVPVPVYRPLALFVTSSFISRSLLTSHFKNDLLRTTIRVFMLLDLLAIQSFTVCVVNGRDCIHLLVSGSDSCDVKVSAAVRATDCGSERKTVKAARVRTMDTAFFLVNCCMYVCAA